MVHNPELTAHLLVSERTPAIPNGAIIELDDGNILTGTPYIWW